MIRRRVVLLLAATGILFAAMPVAFPLAKADPPPVPGAGPPDQSEVLEQLKQINAQLQQLNAMLRSGKARVVVVLNPDADEPGPNLEQ